MTGYTYTTLLTPPAVQLVPGVQHNVLPLLLALSHVTAVHVDLVLPRQLMQHLLPNTRVGGQLEQGGDSFLLVLVKPRLGESWCLEMCRRLVEVEGRLTGSSCRKYNEDSKIKMNKSKPQQILQIYRKSS